MADYALVIGVEQYDYGMPRLPGAAMDAIGFAIWLRSAGIPAENIILLVNTSAESTAEEEQAYQTALQDAGLQVRAAPTYDVITNMARRSEKGPNTRCHPLVILVRPRRQV